LPCGLSQQVEAIANHRSSGNASVSTKDMRFVVDTNALSRLGQSRRASVYFRETARIPSEVLYESQGFPDIGDLRPNEYTTTPEVLDHLAKVMETIEVKDSKLINLYSNTGNADPLVVACALDGQKRGEYSLFHRNQKWVIVSDDKALCTKAEEFKVKVISSDELAALIDKSQGNSLM